MKKVLFFIFYGIGLLWSEPKVVGIFGGQSCPWSKQLRAEVWESPAFQAIQKEEKPPSSSEIETPILIVYSSEGEEIGRLGYLVIPPEKYVTLFKEMETIHQICKNPTVLSITQLLQVYRKCQVLNMKACEEKILEVGIAQDPGVDFLLEQYAKVCKTRHRLAHKIKAEIRARKPNSSAVEWQLALFAFQGKIEKEREINETVKPLKKYLRRYGDQDSDNRWKCHLILAEFYKDKSLMDKARFHAEKAIVDAPDELKQMIAPLGLQ